MRSPENVLESLKSKACNKSYKYERLYRNLYNPQFYLLAYQRIQAKPGNMTAGTDGKTIDGMGMARINALIEKMRDFSYQPNPARRTYIRWISARSELRISADPLIAANVHCHNS